MKEILEYASLEHRRELSPEEKRNLHDTVSRLSVLRTKRATAPTSERARLDQEIRALDARCERIVAGD
jgi:hypothetical protein